MSDMNTNLCWLLSKASHALTTEMSAALEGLGMSARAHPVLQAAMSGEYTQIELARLVGLDKTTMVTTLDELERRGWAERRPSPHDRRARVIAVTAAGEEKVRQADVVMDRIRDDVLGTLPARDREGLMRGLSGLVGDRLADPPAALSAPRRRRVST